MGLFDGLFGSDKPKTTSASTLTGPQKKYLNALIGQQTQYMPGIFSNMYSQATSPTSSYNRTQGDIDTYYQQTMYNPAMQEWRNNTSQQINSAYGNKFHSSARAKALSRSFGDLQNKLSSMRGDLNWNEKLAAQNAQESALGRQMSALSSMYGGLSSPLGVQAKENIAYQNQGVLNRLTQGVGNIAALSAMAKIMI